MLLAVFATLALLSGVPLFAIGVSAKDESAGAAGVAAVLIAILLIAAPHVFRFVCWAMGVSP